MHVPALESGQLRHFSSSHGLQLVERIQPSLQVNRHARHAAPSIYVSQSHVDKHAPPVDKGHMIHPPVQLLSYDALTT